MICVSEAAVAVSPEGAVGAKVSAGGDGLEEDELQPFGKKARLRAKTAARFELDVARFRGAVFMWLFPC